MQATLPTLLIVFAFSFIPLILAEIARKQSLPTLEDFFIQGRSMSTPMVFFTIYSTWVSSYAFLGSTTYFYTRGPLYATCFAWNALFAVLLYVICERIWYYGRMNKYVSPVDFFTDIFDSKPLSLIVAAIMLFFTLPYLQIQLSVGALLIEMVTGGQIHWRMSGLLFYLIIIIYLWAGGLRAVALTDVFYGILCFCSMIIMGFYLAHVSGGVDRIFAFLKEDAPDLLTLMHGNGGSDISLWLSMFLTVPLGAIMGPSIWIRTYAARERKAFRILPFLIGFATIDYLGPILSGAAGHVLMPDAFAGDLDMIIPTLLLKYASPVLCAILFCGIAAAALSTANSQIHASAAIYTITIHRVYINPGASEAKLLSVAKWVVLIISAIAYISMLRSPAYIVDTGSAALAGTAQIIVPTLGALFWGKSSAKAAIVGLISGICIVSATFVTEVNANILGVAALLVNAAVFICLSLVLKPDEKVRGKILHYQASYDENRSKFF